MTFNANKEENPNLNAEEQKNQKKNENEWIERNPNRANKNSFAYFAILFDFCLFLLFFSCAFTVKLDMCGNCDTIAGRVLTPIKAKKLRCGTYEASIEHQFVIKQCLHMCCIGGPNYRSHKMTITRSCITNLTEATSIFKTLSVQLLVGACGWLTL